MLYLKYQLILSNIYTYFKYFYILNNTLMIVENNISYHRMCVRLNYTGVQNNFLSDKIIL